METAQKRRPYRMSARAESVDATRERIMDAAVAAFWERGSTDTSLEDIAAAAGVSRRTVLRHFGSRDGLDQAAMQRELGRIEGMRYTAEPGDPAGVVRALLDHYEELGDRVLHLLAQEGHMAGAEEAAAIGRQAHLDWCRHMFADALAPLDGVARDRRLAQLVAVCDIQVWKLLRRDRGLSRRQTELAIIELLQPLL